MNEMVCEFWNEDEKRCDTRHTYDPSNTPIEKKPNRYYKEICTTDLHTFCWRRIHLKQIVETGAWGD